MRRLFIAGNWKLNKDIHEAERFASALKTALLDIHGVDIAIAPTVLSLPTVCKKVQHTNIEVAAQNIHSHTSGAYTGEVSPSMLKDVGAQSVILGHSERRQYQEESNKLICSKAENALNNNLLTIVCVGESLNQKKGGKTLRVIGEQLKKSLPEKIKFNNLVVAYEPIWAIGSGLVPGNDDIYKVHSFISDKLKSRYGGKAKKIKILYGGSVNKKNASSILSIDCVDGALIGGASLKFSDFKAILDFCN